MSSVMLRIDAHERDAALKAARLLGRDRVLVLPTDTLYGLSSRLGSREAHERIALIKGRGDEQPFVYLAASTDMVERYVAGWGCASRRLMESIWPAPLTAVLEAGARCPAWIGRMIALRVPAHELARRVVELLGEPVSSTSVNRSGESPLNEPAAIEREFGGLVDAALFEKVSPRGNASTIVDLTGERPVVVRAGSYAWPTGVNPSK